MTPLVTTYVVYLAVSVALTIWVAHTLHKNGRVFLVEAFHGKTELADSVNHLLVVGFYLVNLGFICMALKLGYEVATAAGAMEALSRKIGLVLLVLGGMHFFNLLVFSRMRRNARRAPFDYGSQNTPRPSAFDRPAPQGS